jgi:hypothetical protein
MLSDYRVIRNNKDNVSFSIHEVFFDENGIATHMNDEPVQIISENLTNLTNKLIILLSSLTKEVIDIETFNTDFSATQKDALEIFKNV